jgi:hypothetical protein
MLPPGLTFRPCPASAAINDASPACVLAVSAGPAWNERRPTDRILGRAWRVVGNSPSSRPLPQSQRGDGGDNRSRCRGRRPAPHRFSPKGGQGTRRVQQSSVPPSSWPRSTLLDAESIAKPIPLLLVGRTSSTFHRAACASPSVPYSVRSTVASPGNSTRAQLNKTGSSQGSCNSRREV